MANKNKKSDLLEGEVVKKPAPTTKKAVERVSAEFYAGPIPSARELGAYEKVHKGAANRIIGMAEKSLGAEVFSIKVEKTGEILAMLLGRGFLYVCFFGFIYLIVNDKPIEALLAGIPPIASIVYSTFRHSPEKSEKK